MPIRISSAINGFRRAGVAHPSEPTVYPDGYFSAKQVEQLKKEPRLAVEFGDFEVEEPDQTDPSTDQAGTVEPDNASSDVNPDTSESQGEKPEQADPSADQAETVNPDDTSDDPNPDNGENLLQPLMDIIANLDPHDAALWNLDGSPKAANFPKGTVAADRANAWEMFQAQADKA